MLKKYEFISYFKKIPTFVGVKIYSYGECSKTYFRRERI